jgi:ubiquitin-conjugating enzyme E2 H
MAWRRRIVRDLTELTNAGIEVRGENGQEHTLTCFQTIVKGPKDTPYEDCVWHVRFTIPETFPFSSPSVGFVEKIYHPNVDEASGTICLDALNKAWSPLNTVKHIIETVLPYLLTYPNPDDPLNRDAAHLLKTDPEGFNKKAKAHAIKHTKTS